MKATGGGDRKERLQYIQVTRGIGANPFFSFHALLHSRLDLKTCLEDDGSKISCTLTTHVM